MDFEWISSSSRETEDFGQKIGRQLEPGDILVLDGTLAAGKTTLTKGIARGLDVEEPVTSPTFTLISEYEGRIPLYHMDVYRLDSSDDFLTLGAEELLYGEGVSVIEWGEKVADVLPEDAVWIRLDTETDEGDGGCRRRIRVTNWRHGNLAPDQKTGTGETP